MYVFKLQTIQNLIVYLILIFRLRMYLMFNRTFGQELAMLGLVLMYGV